MVQTIYTKLPGNAGGIAGLDILNPDFFLYLQSPNYQSQL